MADNKTVTNTKTSFDADTNPDYTVATDEIGGFDYQIIKLAEGADGTANLISSSNPLPTSNNGNVISTDNSTTSTLSGGATYTGTWEDISQFASVTINIYADVDSGTDGMAFQFSSDGSNADDIYTFTLDASRSTNRRFQFPVTTQYFRVVYTNGASAQTAFRLQTILNKAAVRTSIHRIDDTVNTDRSAELVKAVCAGKIAEEAEAVVGTDGQYENMSLTSWRELRTRDQRALDLQNCNDVSEFTVINDDTDNAADSVDHLFGTGSVTFDKVDGAGNTVFAGLQSTITTVDLSERFESGAFVAMGIKLPSISNVVAVWMRVGTDSSNYNEWEWPVDELTAGAWLALRRPTNQPSSYTGNGWNPASVSYVAFGVEFNAQSNTLAGIVVDNVHMIGGRVTDTTIDASVTSSVNTPNVNLQRVGGTATDTNTGNASAGTQRVVLASDQPVIPISDNAGSLTVDNAALSVTGNGVATGALRVTIANNTTGVINTELPAAATMADGAANPSTPGVTSRNTAYNGTTWDRVRSAGDNADGVSTATLGRVLTNAKNQMYNGTTWDRVRGDTTNGLLVNLGSNNDVTVTGTVTTESDTASSATEATGGVTTSSAQILASNASRLGGYIQNVSDTTVWLSLGGTATTAAPTTKILPNGSFDLTIGNVVYTGAVNAIHGGTGTKNVSIITL